MKNNLRHAMSSYLMYRYFFDGDNGFEYTIPAHIADISFKRMPVHNAEELMESLEKQVQHATNVGVCALALSGGIDSAILAKYMPKGSTAITFRCRVPGRQVIDESTQAAKYAKECGLKHEVIDISWEDIVSVVDTLMLHKGAPIHSIEAQIYLAASYIKQKGFTGFILGENADIIYGGMNGLLAKDWTLGEFIERYCYVPPYKVMYYPEMDYKPFYEFEKDGHIDSYLFTNKYFRQEALGTYINACDAAGIKFIGPYSQTEFVGTIDLERIRSGESKYLVRQVFHQLYPGWEIPTKIPMPRPMNEWMDKWKGPTREEFIPNCVGGLSGDQKWMIFSLERFMDLMDHRVQSVL